MLELGALFMRTETELLLKSRWVVPTKLLAAGFEFEFPELEAALRSILRPASADPGVSPMGAGELAS